MQAVTGSPASVSHAYQSVGSYQVTATATDNVGTYDATNAATSAYFVPVQVAVAGPADLALSVPISIVEGGTATLSGSFTDADATATHLVQVNWGDGSPVTTVTLPAGVLSFSGPTAIGHTYANNSAGNPSGGDTIQVQVSNGRSGLLTARSTTIAVLNAPPAGLTAVPSATRIGEGGSITLSGGFTDPGAPDAHTVDVHWGDGSPDTILGLGSGILSYATAPHTYANNLAGNAPYPITVTVADGNGGSASAGAQIEVDNLAPAGLLLIGPSQVGVGAAASLSGSFADAGLLDAHTVDIDWGDDTPHGVIHLPAGATRFGTDGSVSHRYLASSAGQPGGLYAISVTVTDDGGAAVEAGTSVQVNGQTSALAVNSASGTYGGTATLSASLTSSAGGPIGQQEVAFSLGGVYVGMAMTGPDGVATLPRRVARRDGRRVLCRGRHRQLRGLPVDRRVVRLGRVGGREGPSHRDRGQSDQALWGRRARADGRHHRVSSSARPSRPRACRGPLRSPTPRRPPAPSRPPPTPSPPASAPWPRPIMTSPSSPAP